MRALSTDASPPSRLLSRVWATRFCSGLCGLAPQVAASLWSQVLMWEPTRPLSQRLCRGGTRCPRCAPRHPPQTPMVPSRALLGARPRVAAMGPHCPKVPAVPCAHGCWPGLWERDSDFSRERGTSLLTYCTLAHTLMCTCYTFKCVFKKKRWFENKMKEKEALEPSGSGLSGRGQGAPSQGLVLPLLGERRSGPGGGDTGPTGTAEG